MSEKSINFNNNFKNLTSTLIATLMKQGNFNNFNNQFNKTSTFMKVFDIITLFNQIYHCLNKIY